MAIITVPRNYRLETRLVLAIDQLAEQMHISNAAAVRMLLQGMLHVLEQRGYNDAGGYQQTALTALAEAAVAWTDNANRRERDGA